VVVGIGVTQGFVVVVVVVGQGFGLHSPKLTRLYKPAPSTVGTVELNVQKVKAVEDNRIDEKDPLQPV